ncbi:MAG: phage regulatory protein/antirepressor Ant [Micrococcus sp.]|nr:phage regulatory protein/antirepressor Ant [Micrococcus sp.]
MIDTSTLPVLVQRDTTGLFTTSEAIATGAGVEHRAVLQLVGKYEDDLAEFGPSAFEMRKSEGRPTRVAKLNEQQATLLLTYLKNTAQVRAFKKALVKAFYEMAVLVRDSRPKTLEERTQELMGELSAVVDRQRAELEAAAPKVQAYDQFMDADGTYSVGNVAKMLGLSQNKLFTELRNAGVLIGKGHMRNTPYQQYMHHFTVKAHTFTRSDGTEGTGYTTRIQPGGLSFIQRKLGLVPTAPAQTELAIVEGDLS